MELIIRRSSKPMIVDEDDYRMLRGWTIYLDAQGYAKVILPRPVGSVLVHRLIVSASGSDRIVDHVDGNRLNNRRANLRVGRGHNNQINRKRLNANNKSGVRGVCWCNTFHVWKASITVNRRMIQLGSFKTKDEAIAARHGAEVLYFGELCPTSETA